MNIQEKLLEEYKEICEQAEIKKKYVFAGAYTVLKTIKRK